MHEFQYFKPVDCSCKCSWTSRSSAVPWVLVCLTLPMPTHTSAPVCMARDTLVPQHSQKHCPVPLACGISVELPSATSSMFKSKSRKPDLLPAWTPALSKAKSSPRSKTNLFVCKEHQELQALNTTNAPAGRDTGPLAFLTKWLSTRQDQGIFSQSSSDL